jgi:tricorn protease
VTRALFPLLLLFGSLSAVAAAETLLLQEPTVSKTQVAFVYAQDLWIVARSGGTARRLTSSQGAERSPRFSPDGQWVAYTAQYAGNDDVYVIPTAGGTPRRMTWHPGRDQVQGWHPSGRSVLFSSARANGLRQSQLFEASLTGGPHRALPIPRVSRAAYSLDAKRIAYTPIRDAFRSWKRYRGGRTTPIWIYDVASHEVEVVPHQRASDTFPCWLGESLYFASDRDRAMNVYRFKPGTKTVVQLTHFKAFDVRNMSSGPDAIVFEQAGAIHILSAQGEATRLRITVPHDGLDSLPRWRSVKGNVRSASLGPKGKRVAFEARGEIVTVPREHGAARVLSRTPGAHDRDPAYSPDGSRLAWFSDAKGEYHLVVRELTTGKETSFELGRGFVHDPVWSPDSKRVLFSDKSNRIAYVTLESGALTEVAQLQGSLGVIQPTVRWSPDGAWIAFEERNPETAYDQISLFEVASGKVQPITDAFGSADSPAFSPDGRLLFFQGSTQSGPNRFGLDMSASASRSWKGNLYVVVLSKEGSNPLAKRSDEVAATAASPAAKTGEETKPTLDLDGLGQRILAVPVPEGQYRGLAAVNSSLYFVKGSWREGELRRYDFTKREEKQVAADARWFQISADGKNLLTLDKGGKYHLGELEKPGKPVSVDGVKVRVDPAREWAQILREVWRIQRDYFYDPKMHGVDWPAMWARWSAFLPHVKHRADLNLLISELIGELATGHQYVWGGQTPARPKGVPVGLLGADFDHSEGRYRLARIYRGQNWNPSQRAPLTEPGVDAKVGDVLLAVNGSPLTTRENLYRAFENTAGRVTELVLQRGESKLTVKVVPIGNEAQLRYRSWVESRRARVKKLSGGRLAYVHMPDTGNRGMASFDRDYYSQLNKQGLVIDIRYNRGGKVADYVVNVLRRDVLCHWMNREGWGTRTPFGTFSGPKAMVINEYAGSGGDALPWLFKNTKLGKLVGQRTWGGLVGISGYPSLMDGGKVTAASFGVMDREGKWAVENVGVSPDVEVTQFPKPIIEGQDPQLDAAIELVLKDLKGERFTPAYTPPAKR